MQIKRKKNTSIRNFKYMSRYAICEPKGAEQPHSSYNLQNSSNLLLNEGDGTEARAGLARPVLAFSFLLAGPAPFPVCMGPRVPTLRPWILRDNVVRLVIK